MSRLHRFAVRRAAVLAILGTMACHMPGLSFAQTAPPENFDPAAASPFADPLFAEMVDQIRQARIRCSSRVATRSSFFNR
jgi:hypothetical protein